MHKWSGLLSNVKASRLWSHVRMSGQVFHCCHKSCLRGLSLRLGRNRTPALGDGRRAVWSYRWRTWSLFSSPVVGDKCPPANPVCHCQQDWWGSESVVSGALQWLDVQHMNTLLRKYWEIQYCRCIHPCGYQLFDKSKECGYMRSRCFESIKSLYTSSWCVGFVLRHQITVHNHRT